MTIRIAINGYGRIGRNVLRALYENNRRDEFEIVAINDLGDIAINAHLTQFDTTHGRFPGQVSSDGKHMHINDDVIALTCERNAEQLPWAKLKIDVVLECTGAFTERDKAMAHIKAGAKKVIISAPGKNADATIVYGVNHHILNAEHTIISNASCTTNCLAPMAKVLNDSVGIERGLMNTIHAYTSDQNLIDGHHKDYRRARAAAHSIIPTKTGAAVAVGMVLPELKGKLDGFAMRVPTINVSVVDLTFIAKRNTSVEEINTLLQDAADNAFKGVIAVNHLPLVSTDFNHHPASCIFDATQTKVMDGNFINICAWYDNEWGFSNRMLDTALSLIKAQ